MARNNEQQYARLLAAAILVCLALQAWLALVMEINWDEFYYLSQIYDYQRGELPIALQTIHVHLFGWLTAVGGDEIRQVIVGRFVMLGCETVTCALVYALARIFFSPTASLLAALAFASAGFTILDGASFRTDPLAAMLAMAALVLVARGRATLWTAVAAGLWAALSALVTVKVIFFAPAFLAVAAWRWRTSSDRMRSLVWLAEAANAALLLFGGLYWLHLQSLPKASLAGSRTMMHGAASTTVINAGLLPRAATIVRWAILSPAQAVLLLLGLVAAVLLLWRRPAERFRILVVLGCAAPLLSLLFYRNAFPYFFPFILPPAILLVAAFIDALAFSSLMIAVLALPMLFWAAVVANIWSAHGQAAQRQLVSAVHAIFPRPVAYIDRNSMIASFPKRGFFMSTWGMANYRQGRPLFGDVLAHETVPLLIVNGPALKQATGMISGLPKQYRLYPQDEAVLRGNFIPHWGRIWVAGKHLQVSVRGSQFTIATPGIYTVEAGPVQIDGQPEAPGATLMLTRGIHQIRSRVPKVVTLRWGDRLYRPPTPSISGLVYRGF